MDGNFGKNDANGFDDRGTVEDVASFVPVLGGNGGLGGIDERRDKGNESTNSGACICG